MTELQPPTELDVLEQLSIIPKLGDEPWIHLYDFDYDNGHRVEFRLDAKLRRACYTITEGGNVVDSGDFDGVTSISIEPGTLGRRIRLKLDLEDVEGELDLALDPTPSVGVSVRDGDDRTSLTAMADIEAPCRQEVVDKLSITPDSGGEPWEQGYVFDYDNDLAFGFDGLVNGASYKIKNAGKVTASGDFDGVASISIEPGESGRRIQATLDFGQVKGEVVVAVDPAPSARVSVRDARNHPNPTDSQ